MGTDSNEVGTKEGCPNRTLKSDLIMDPEAQIAIVLAQDIVHYVGFGEKDRPLPCRHAKTLRKTVGEMLQRHEILFNAMVKKLDITSEDGRETFSQIADEMFRDSPYNWGRVVSLYAFAARLAKHCVTLGKTNFVDKLAGYVGLYTAQNLNKWIKESGGWDAFEQYFHGDDQDSMESFVWRGLVVTAMGLGALAATMIAAR